MAFIDPTKRFPEGSRVVFFGDSMTASGLWLAYIQQYYTKILHSDVRIYNCGTGSTTIPMGLSIIDKDVMKYKPTHVVFLYCGNDVGFDIPMNEDGVTDEAARKERAGRLAAYRANVKRAISMFRERGVEVILATPTPTSRPHAVTDPEEGPVQCAKILFEIAEEEHLKWPVLNIFARMVSARRCADMYVDDKVHHNDVGNAVYAKLFLREQGFDAYTELPMHMVPIDELPELDEKLAERVRAEEIVRVLWATETNLLCEIADAPLEAKLARLNERIPTKANGQWIDFYLNIAQKYVKWAPDFDKHVQRVLDLTEEYIASCANN